jgi:hypothetical protein
LLVQNGKGGTCHRWLWIFHIVLWTIKAIV